MYDLYQGFSKLWPVSQIQPSVFIWHYEVQPVHSEGYQPWDFFGRNDAKAETLVLWPPHVKSVMDRETWHAAIHGITKSWTRLSD